MASELDALEILKVADPETYFRVKERVSLWTPLPGKEQLARLAEEIVWGLSQERGLSEAFAEGLLTLIQSGLGQRIDLYVDLVHQAARTGATLGRIMATFSTPVVMASDVLLSDFKHTVAVMQGKGTYTLTAPLEVLAYLLDQRDTTAAAAYLELLKETFQQQISYNLSLRMAYLLPKAVRGFASRRRLIQIQMMVKLIKIDLQLADPFLEGLSKGLGLLDEDALYRFVGQALHLHLQSDNAGKKYLSLSSKVGQDDCAALQKAVPLSWVKGQLNRYLQARIGQSVAIKPLSDLGTGADGIPWVCSDSRAIYLCGEISYHDAADQNRELYKDLVRLEAGYFEYGTFDFDLERALDQYPALRRVIGSLVENGRQPTAGDGETFIQSFALPMLADDLFTLFEQARIANRMGDDYPGLMRQVVPKLIDEFKRNAIDDTTMSLAALFANLVLGIKPGVSGTLPAIVAKALTALYAEHRWSHNSVEKSAELVCLAIEVLDHELGKQIVSYRSMKFPFGRRLRWPLVGIAFSSVESTIRRFKAILAQRGLSIYRSDLRQHLAAGNGRLGMEEIAKLVLAGASDSPNDESIVLSTSQELESLLNYADAAADSSSPTDRSAFRYPEWDTHMQDYLHDHTCVQETDLPNDSGSEVYRRTLARHRGLIIRMRRAFELLKPEELSLLRQWPEGDAFDYRALIDFVIDRRAGLIPSQRLFIKRLKQQRDVAVLLLVDLSRSTANPVAGRHTTVLGVAKEALVLFCEALQVVGDSYAIAGFSGTGRHRVEYFRIKDFEEPLSKQVQARISALSPQRSTRMGAALRHATARLMGAASRVRLMIVLSDGFPNDVGYKSDYAIADTYHAVQEARAKNFHVKAITVNIGSDPRLDELYGRVHHHVIGDVAELPDKLLRLYGVLTRY
jgi:hypothetical protein